jgi:hypothetical protein
MHLSKHTQRGGSDSRGRRRRRAWKRTGGATSHTYRIAASAPTNHRRTGSEAEHAAHARLGPPTVAPPLAHAFEQKHTQRGGSDSRGRRRRRAWKRTGGATSHTYRIAASAPTNHRRTGSEAGHAAHARLGPPTVAPPLAHALEQKHTQWGGSDSRGRRRRRAWKRTRGRHIMSR